MPSPSDTSTDIRQRIDAAIQDHLIIGVDSGQAYFKETDFVIDAIEALLAEATTGARQEEHDWLFDKFGDTNIDGHDWELIRNEAESRMNSFELHNQSKGMPSTKALGDD
jgi:hypothetical protein